MNKIIIDMTDEEIKSILKKNIIERMELVMDEEEIIDDELLFGYDDNGGGLGLDSIDVLELIVIIKKEFNIEINEAIDKKILININSLTEFILNQRNN